MNNTDNRQSTTGRVLPDEIRYMNGNRLIVIRPFDGTMVRYARLGDASPFIPERPENMDINLSYRCTNGCPFCYLGATPHGSEWVFDKQALDKIFAGDIRGMEAAINFNEGQSTELTRQVADYFLSRGAIPNITVHANTLVAHPHLLEDLHGVSYGVSVSSLDEVERVENALKRSGATAPGVLVWHIILGVFPRSDFLRLRDKAVLLLGYKHLGRGKRFARNNAERLTANALTIDDIRTVIQDNNCTIAMDVLAMEQLHYSPEPEFFLGRDGEVSFYLDLVRMRYGVSSTEPERYPVGNKNCRQMFQHVRTLVNAPGT